VSEEHVVIELNPGERRLYDRLRARVVAPRLGGNSGLRDFALLLPDLTVLLFRLLREPQVPLRAKLIALAGVGYILSPIDLLPEIVLGPFGLLDDLIVVGAALSRVLNHVHPDVVRSHWSGKGDVLEVIQRLSAWIEAQFSQRLRSALRGIFRLRISR